MSQLDAELEHAGEETALSPQMLLLEQLRITPEKELPKMDFLFRLFDKPCFPRRELVAITGKAKSGKTFVTSMLMAVGSLTPDPSPEGEGSINQLPLKRIREEPLHVLWYDTEQSDESTQDILNNRIIPMMSNGNDATTPLALWRGAGGEAFNVRGVAWKERRSLLCEAVTRCKPDLVIVDGIRDLVNDINDGMLAQEVMEELMQLATEHKCCIVCVLHQNKNGEDRNLRGWIGTELMNKAFEVLFKITPHFINEKPINKNIQFVFEVYACEKLPQRIFSLEQTLTRKYDIEQAMYFKVGGDGLPVSCTAPTDTGSKESRQDKLPPLNQEYIVHEEDGRWSFDVRRLFTDALRNEDEVSAHEYRERVMQLSGITVPFTYNVQLNKALEQKVIMRVQHDRMTYYQPAPF